jgi:hypothetical protein
MQFKVNHHAKIGILWLVYFGIQKDLNLNILVGYKPLKTPYCS